MRKGGWVLALVVVVLLEGNLLQNNILPSVQSWVYMCAPTSSTYTSPLPLDCRRGLTVDSLIVSRSSWAKPQYRSS